jgi:hypothetical protein
MPFDRLDDMPILDPLMFLWGGIEDVQVLRPFRVFLRTGVEFVIWEAA